MKTRMSSRVKRFERFCVKEHRRQRYGKYPYGFHLRGVREIAMYYRFNSIDEQVLALGHDLDEDTYVTVSDKMRAGASRLALRFIWCLMDEPGVDRKQRKSRTYPKIRRFVVTAAIKVADRLRNLLQCFIEGNRRMFNTYNNEEAGFEKGIGMVNDIRLKRMWTDLKWLFENAEELFEMVPHGKVPRGAPGWMMPIISQSRCFQSRVS
jgi:hypothetical protein